MNDDTIQKLEETAARVKKFRPGHPALQILSGRAPTFASALDQRFSFTVYTPSSHDFHGPELPLVVAVHGTARKAGELIDWMASFAEEHRCVVLAPLFPCGIIDFADVHNYKEILYRSIRFDHILLSMVDQAAYIWRIRTDKFFMHGFSGGGQFCHRFFYLHPHRLLGLSIGAPGRITVPNTQHAWPLGVSNIQEVFEMDYGPDFRQMSEVPVHFVVGEKDTSTKMIESKNEFEEGSTRLERIQILRDSWTRIGVRSTLSIVPGVKHEGKKCLPAVLSFLAPLLDAVERAA
ncbi:poly hydrolase [Punctularia strigosozonata HHB-11173 SS5]|uniref:Poly hydrolase n=1 Tax=Punctularia strigosozonata (strain HHB-11173) TaxID=741275 RepID=R7S134_PUNST|nr:poly hydrolase [Punctularia strigosozonata HHB-11173 SS5]EIN03559.1 poly hydrolase [Punctularia strigosozonata HHB-11173 SS5]